jgi:triosephosphate isomerase
MYFGFTQTLDWCAGVAELATQCPVVVDGSTEFFVVPSTPMLAFVAPMLARARVGLGAQDLSEHDSGAYTGDVSGAMLAAAGCRYVEVGHAERRRLHGETDALVAAKTDAALRNGLTPVLCVGESEPVSPSGAAARALSQLESALAVARAADRRARVIVAYEPMWAIGAPLPAPVDHISEVCFSLREKLDADPDFHGSIIYGGSAGPGLLGVLGKAVDGLFLGRFAHQITAIASVLNEGAKVK